MATLKRTPLYPEYKEAGAKNVDFGGWELPIQFKGIIHEHEVTRTKAGLFDVSHMGEIVVKGPKSKAFLQYMTTNNVENLAENQVQYSCMCYPDGGTVDDFLIYHLKKDHYLLVVNAANTQKDFAWLQENNTYNVSDVIIEDVSDQYAVLALQGPKAEQVLQRLTEMEIAKIGFFRFKKEVYFPGIDISAMVSRTGYTGEDGFEIYLDPADAPSMWKHILKEGNECRVEPIGLGARDTLRFEVNLPLYGQELSRTISPIEAGITFAVKTNKSEDFIGKQALADQLNSTLTRKIVGIEMIDKGIPRQGYPVLIDNNEVGFVTTGTKSPSLNKNIGLALVEHEAIAEGTELYIQVRKRKLRAIVVALPFYKRK